MSHHPSIQGSRPARWVARGRLVANMRERLESQSAPRLQMALIVSLTGLAGLLASMGLLKWGMHQMVWRYPLAVLFAYGAFIGLLWIWLKTRTEDWLEAGETSVDMGGDALIDAVSRTAGRHSFNSVGSRVDANLSDRRMAQASDTVDAGQTLGSWGDWANADEAVWVLVVLGVLCALGIAAFYLVFQAPVLFAEVALDGAIVGSLYYRLRESERQHWLHTTWQHTRWPLFGLLLIVMVCGWCLGMLAPEASTLGQVWAVVHAH